MTTILFLFVSNVIMTLAWYGHLRFPHLPMLAAILAGWGIALLEYFSRCRQTGLAMPMGSPADSSR
jgi:uncharacterized protein (DUF486 family)